MITYDKVVTDYNTNKIAILGFSLTEYIDSLIETAYKNKQYNKATRLENIRQESENDF